jgi:hypothetical protein
MESENRSIAESRRAQMFPTLSDVDIDRLRRFGELRTYRAGTFAAQTGAVAPGLQVILRGQVLVAPHEEHMRDQPIVTQVRVGSWANSCAGVGTAVAGRCNRDHRCRGNCDRAAAVT